MYIQYAKDRYSGRILGVVVATATNQVGFALAKPSGDITRTVKDELIMVAIARSYQNTIKENMDILNDFINNASNFDFFNKVNLVADLYKDMCWKATHSASLPTMVHNKELV